MKVKNSIYIFNNKDEDSGIHINYSGFAEQPYLVTYCDAYGQTWTKMWDATSLKNYIDNSMMVLVNEGQIDIKTQIDLWVLPVKDVANMLQKIAETHNDVSESLRALARLKELNRTYHFCFEWDGMCISSDDPEWDMCSCRIKNSN